MSATKHGPSWLRFEGGQWTEIPESVTTVRHIFELAIKGYSPMTIQRKLEEAKMPPIGRRRVAPEGWDANMVDKLLKSQAVIGLAEDRKGNAIARYPDVVPYDDWLLVQELRGIRSRGKKAGIGNLFSSRIYCAECGSPLRFRNARHGDRQVYLGLKKGSITVPYLTCPKRCIGQIDYQQLELWVEDFPDWARRISADWTQAELSAGGAVGVDC